MEVYIEYVLLDNMVINGLLLILTKQFLKLNIKTINIIFSSFLGTLFAFLMPFIILPSVLLFFLKLLIATIMIGVLTHYKNYTDFFVTVLTFFSATFLFGGLIFYLMDILNAKTTNSGILLYEYEIPMGLIVFILSVYAYFMISLIKNFYKKKVVNEFLYKVSIKNDKRTVNATGFLDTGNRLIEPVTRKPIVIISYKIFSDLYDNVKIIDLLLGKIENLPLKDCKYLSIESVNSAKNKLLVFKSDELKIFSESGVNIIQDVILGLSLKKFSDVIDYNVLLNPLLFSI